MRLTNRNVGDDGKNLGEIISSVTDKAEEMIGALEDELAK
jgi:hypothetical protein